VPISNTAAAALGANHPDNPFPGTAARLSYNPGLEIGPNTTSSGSTSVRTSAGIKGVVAGWDYDTAVTYSQSEQKDVAEKRINYRVSNALLNPTAANVAAAAAFSPAYAALPAGTVWRIGENSYLNSPAMYAALLQDQSRTGSTKQYGIDGKVSREIGKLPGGPIGVAIGGEYRHEQANLPYYSGFGDYIGLSLTKYQGSRNIYAAYTEVLAPVLKQVELNGAVRYDHYSDAGSAVTPKIGLKYKPVDNFALRGTYAFGFRAPSFAQNRLTSLATFSGSTVNDPARCAAAPGLPAANCTGQAPAFLQQGNPNLKPEKSRSATLGMVWDITPKDSLAIDLWQIKRKGLPVTENSQAAITAGHYVRDPSASLGGGDPGPILTAFVQFINASTSTTRGIDLDAKSRWDLPNGYGRLNTSVTYTHLMMQRVTDDAGTHDYAGTHGNCDITNCMGSPRDKVSAAATWVLNQYRLGLNANFRGSFKNTFEQTDTSCATSLGNGNPAPNGCRIASFTTFDLSGGYSFSKQTEVFGFISNIFKKSPPWDPLTYGAIGYNPMDYSGAIGRYFRVGLTHRF
jgi:iron complex outermembrane recepter protein